MTTPEPEGAPEAQSPSISEPPPAPPFEPDDNLVEYFKRDEGGGDLEDR